MFRQLTKSEVKQIADIMLKQVFKRAEEKGIKIDVTGERYACVALTTTLGPLVVSRAVTGRGLQARGLCLPRFRHTQAQLAKPGATLLLTFITLSYPPAERFKDRLVDEGYNPSYGARPLRRAIMRLLEDSMAERMLAGDIKEGDSVIIDGELALRGECVCMWGGVGGRGPDAGHGQCLLMLPGRIAPCAMQACLLLTHDSCLACPGCCSGCRRPDLGAQRRQEDDLRHSHCHRHRLLGLSWAGIARPRRLGAARLRAYCPPAISLRYSPHVLFSRRAAGRFGTRSPPSAHPVAPRARQATPPPGG